MSRRAAAGRGRLRVTRLPSVAFLVLLVLAPHLLGGVYSWATVGLSIAASGLLVALVTVYVSRSDSWGSEPLIPALLLMLTTTCVPAIPLPRGWVAALSPSVLAHHVMTAQGLDLAVPSWLPLSLAPGSTQERLVFTAGVIAAFCAARVISMAAQSSPILIAVAISALSVALSHLTHRMFGAKAVYGLYVPSFAPSATGPLLNPNNFAGFMGFGLPLCMGLGLRAGGTQRWLWWLATGVIAAAGLLAGSRSGTAIIAAGPPLLGILHVLRTHRDRRSSRSEVAAGGAFSSLAVSALKVAGLLAVLAAAGYGLAELAADDFIDSDYQDLSKLELLRSEASALLLDPRAALLGVGRGGFADWFAAAYRGPGRALFAECLPLQYAIEYGIPLTLVFALSAVWRVHRDFWRWRSPAHLGGLVGVLVLVLQNAGDYGLEMSGIALPAAACFGASLPHRVQSPNRAARSLVHLKVWAPIMGALCLLLSVVVGPSAWRNDGLRAERTLVRASAANDRTAFWATFREAAPAHPATAIFATLAAEKSVLEGSSRAPFWLNRAMVLAPSWGSTHLWAAHWLVGVGRSDQALGELGLAANSRPGEAARLFCDRLAVGSSAETILQIAPVTGPARLAFLEGAASCLEPSSLASTQLDERILQGYPHNIGALERGVRRRLAAKDFQRALEEAQRLRNLVPHLTAAYLAEAEALRSLDRPQEAVQILLSAARNAADRRAALGALAWTYVSVRDERGLRETIDQLRMEAGSNTLGQVASLALLGHCEAALGNDARALKAWQEAVYLGAGPDTQDRAAGLAAKLGQVDLARRLWNSLCVSHPDGGYCAKRDELTRRLDL